MKSEKQPKWTNQTHRHREQMGGCQRRRRLGDGAWNRWRRSRGTKSSVIKQISHLLCVMYSMATIVSDTVLQIWKSLSFQEKDTCTLMFTAALFTIAEVWKQPNCKWIKRCGIYWKKKECYDVGDRWYLDLLWCSFFRVYKCQIIMILEEGPTDFHEVSSPPPKIQTCQSRMTACNT